MNNASDGLSPEMALLLVRGVQGQEGVTLSGAQGALDRLVANGTIRGSYVDQVKAALGKADAPKVERMLIGDDEKQKKENLKYWYGSYAVLIYSDMGAGKLRDDFLLGASRAADAVNAARHDANARLGGDTPPEGSGSKFEP
ncbi:hypothetical protein CEE56_02580 [Stenotrophomonas maltophilia]|uniref:Uncharacterized protein n=1 Tax=Stenotrophomonas maltophilia TaxID=40324 RepID=A0AA41CE33_STEMA|nr:hypothetical protein [Stenotrophomonas maltophilia]OWQ76593.1 hypothetical protein CEE56_02580 [Stenotrophomonas maltophilia]